MENKRIISTDNMIEALRAFYIYTAGVKFVSREIKEEAIIEYVRKCAPLFEAPTNPFLGKPALRPEDIVEGFNIPDYVLAYNLADLAVEKVGQAYNNASEALRIIGITGESASNLLKELSAANWNAERVREKAYRALLEAGGSLQYQEYI